VPVTDTPTDGELLRAADHDPHAFRLLYERWANRCWHSAGCAAQSSRAGAAVSSWGGRAKGRFCLKP
jgi:hypothetical protein